MKIVDAVNNLSPRSSESDRISGTLYTIGYYCILLLIYTHLLHIYKHIAMYSYGISSFVLRYLSTVDINVIHSQP